MAKYCDFVENFQSGPPYWMRMRITRKFGFRDALWEKLDDFLPSRKDVNSLEFLDKLAVYWSKSVQTIQSVKSMC
jgi:hypothetical protein